MKYWLVKTEPVVYSIDDLAREKKKTTYWDGVRNYQARNTLRDSMKLGDLVFIYHSNADPTAIVGVAKVVREGYPDFTSWDPKHDHYDEASTEQSPRWFMVDLQLVSKFKKQVTLQEMRDRPELAKMELLRKGSRLSVQPVTEGEYHEVLLMAGEVQ